MGIEFRKPTYKNSPCPNFGSRIRAIIIHYTEINLQETLEKFADPNSQVSSHYVVDKNGDIYNLIDDIERAWHAGESCWNGEANLNNYSIGIEIVNSGFEPYIDEQINSVITLVSYLKAKYNIKNYSIIGHSDIASERKQDPGKLFPWKKLAENNLGIYLLDDIIHNQKPNYNYKIDISAVQNKLASYGYKIAITNIVDQQTINVIKAFNDHFYPEIYNKYSNLTNDSLVLMWDDASDLILDYLLTAKNSS